MLSSGRSSPVGSLTVRRCTAAFRKFTQFRQSGSGSAVCLFHIAWIVIHVRAMTKMAASIISICVSSLNACRWSGEQRAALAIATLCRGWVRFAEVLSARARMRMGFGWAQGISPALQRLEQSNGLKPKWLRGAQNTTDLAVNSGGHL